MDNEPARLRPDTNFCQKLSKGFEQAIKDADDDPRAAIGKKAIDGLKKTGGWVPDVSSRDARGPEYSEFKKKS